MLIFVLSVFIITLPIIILTKDNMFIYIYIYVIKNIYFVPTIFLITLLNEEYNANLHGI